MSLSIALDSGAHSIYNMMFAGVAGVKGLASRLYSNYQYADSPKFKKYLENYIEFLHNNKDNFSFYVSLDIIFNPEKSWEVLKYLESNGLKPLPVFHFGEDFSWLKKYIDNYEYIGVGGLGQDITVMKYINFGDQVFKYIKGSDGRPVVKTHGFAINATLLLRRYQWYSVDASSWTAFARNGVICLPRPIWKKRKVIRYNYLTRPVPIPITERSETKLNHYLHQVDISKQVINDYLQICKFTAEEARNQYYVRDMINLRLYKNMETSLKVYYKDLNGWDGGNIYFAGQPSCSVTVENLNRIVDYFNHDIKFLPSFFYKRHVQDCIEVSSLKRVRIKSEKS